MSRFVFILLFLCQAYQPVMSQSFEPKHTFNIELSLPNGFSNQPFKKIMQGLVNVSPYYQYTFKNHFVLGAGLRYSYFAVNEFKVPEKTYGGMHTGGIFLKAGWEKFHNDRFATDLSVKFGYTQNVFVTQKSDTVERFIYQNNCTYIEPSLGLILTVDEFSSYRLVIGYGIQGFGFRPAMIGLETFGGYDPKNFSRVTSFLIVGFGYTHYFHDKN